MVDSGHNIFQTFLICDAATFLQFSVLYWFLVIIFILIRIACLSIALNIVYLVVNDIVTFSPSLKRLKHEYVGCKKKLICV